MSLLIGSNAEDQLFCLLAGEAVLMLGRYESLAKVMTPNRCNHARHFYVDFVTESISTVGEETWGIQMVSKWSPYAHFTDFEAVELMRTLQLEVVRSLDQMFGWEKTTREYATIFSLLKHFFFSKISIWLALLSMFLLIRSSRFESEQTSRGVRFVLGGISCPKQCFMKAVTLDVKLKTFISVLSLVSLL